jgi:hypothetical protein
MAIRTSSDAGTPVVDSEPERSMPKFIGQSPPTSNSSSPVPRTPFDPFA